MLEVDFRFDEHCVVDNISIVRVMKHCKWNESGQSTCRVHLCSRSMETRRRWIRLKETDEMTLRFTLIKKRKDHFVTEWKAKNRIIFSTHQHEE